MLKIFLFQFFLFILLAVYECIMWCDPILREPMDALWGFLWQIMRLYGQKAIQRARLLIEYLDYFYTLSDTANTFITFYSVSFFFLSAKAKWIFLPYIMPMIVISGSRRKQSFLMSFCDRKWKKKKIPRYIQITIEFWMPKKLFYFCFELQVILLHFFFESPENKSNEIKRR